MLQRFGPTGTTLLLLFLNLLAVPVLYLARALDGNTLVSWRWVFQPEGVARLYFWFLTSAAAAAGVACIEVSGRWRYAVLAVLGLLAVFPLLELPEVLLDASRHLLQARAASEAGPARFLENWGRSISVWTDLPLPPFLYGVSFELSGTERIGAQGLNLTLFIGTLFLVYGTGKQLWDEETGFHGALLLLAIPFLPVQVPLLLVDIHALFFLALSFFLFARAAARGHAGVHVAAGMGAGLALMTKYSLWPMLLFVPLFYGGGPRKAEIHRLSALYVLIGVLAVFGPFFTWKVDVVVRQIGLLRQFQLPALGRWTEGWVSVFLFQAHPLIGFGALAAGVSLFRSGDRNWRLAAGLILFVVVFRATRIRYLLPLLPVLTLLAARGLSLIPFSYCRRFAVFAAVFLSGVVLMGAYRPFLMRTSAINLSRAGAMIETFPEEAVRVAALPQAHSEGRTDMAIPLLGFFTKKRLFQAEPWGPADRPDTASRSPLRFTWETPKPRFLEPSAGDLQSNPSRRAPLLLLSSDPPDIAELRQSVRRRLRKINVKDTAVPCRRKRNRRRRRTLTRPAEP